MCSGECVLDRFSKSKQCLANLPRAIPPPTDTHTQEPKFAPSYILLFSKHIFYAAHTYVISYISLHHRSLKPSRAFIY